jgi:O-antigen/teichoic acid export membrane protein
MALSTLNRGTRALSTTADQVFSSASNGIFTFAVAVASSTQSFGKIVLIFTALVTILGVQRGAVGTPLLLKSDQTTEQIRRDGSYALVAGLAIGCAVLVVMVAWGHAVGLPAVLLGVSAPILLCQDVLRYVTFAEGRPHVAATWDGVWFLGTLLLLVSAWLKLSTVPWLIGGWAVLGLVAFAGMAADLRIAPQLGGFGRWAKANWQHRIRFGIDAGAEQIGVFLVLALVAALLSPTATAALRGATVLLSPLAILAGALQLVVISESTRNSAQPREVWYAALRLMGGIAALTAVIGVVLCLLPASVGALLLGPSFEPARHVLPIVLVGYFATAVGFVLAVFLKTFNRSSDVMRYKIVSTVVTIAAAACAASLFHSASGVAVGLAVAAILMTAVGLAYYAPWEVRNRTSSLDNALGGFDE